MSQPTFSPSQAPYSVPSQTPSTTPSSLPLVTPTTSQPTFLPPLAPTITTPSSLPSQVPLKAPSQVPSGLPSQVPSQSAICTETDGHVRRAFESHHRNLNITLVFSHEQMEALKRKEFSFVFHSKPCDPAPFTVDVISIGSRSRPKYMEAQVDTWASHKAI
eukprot:9692073-Ditylum_brightwellii.AAC.1